jgi:hypothetical protein
MPRSDPPTADPFRKHPLKLPQPVDAFPPGESLRREISRAEPFVPTVESKVNSDRTAALGQKANLQLAPFSEIIDAPQERCFQAFGQLDRQ